MAGEKGTTVRELLLVRRGLVFVTSAQSYPDAKPAEALALEFANLGYALSNRLEAQLSRCSLGELAALREWALAALLAQVGGTQKHKPLFRRFPGGIPSNTAELWWTKVLVHFLQAEGQPCLFCRRIGSTHVLVPCRHVVCDACFDGDNYSACPVCEHHVDDSSPFFLPSEQRGLPKERVTFKLLDLGADIESEARSFFLSLCSRKQALSPADRDALVAILTEYRGAILGWLPTEIPLRENVATVFGTLLETCDPALVVPVASRYMKTATDVLRLVAVMSGYDGSLLRETVFKTYQRTDVPSRFWVRVAEMLGATPPVPQPRPIAIPVRVSRFKVRKLSRPLRRALLALLEAMNATALVEDMLRHRSYWVWVGEFLHPHEWAARFPNVAAAFRVVRQKAPDGTLAPPFFTWNARLEHSIQSRDVDATIAILLERPGEFARHLDHVLRVADGAEARAKIIEAFSGKLRSMATPVLLTLSSHLPTRAEKAAVRVYWPKTRVATGVSSPDTRAVLVREAIEPLTQSITAELLQRFGTKPAYPSCIVDEALQTILVPFNERTASRAAVALPRGSRITVPTGKVLRMFLHWCQPERGGRTTDLDLSVGLYDDAWQQVGVCSYFQLKTSTKTGRLIAQSSGDLRDAPWPDGATEFVDLHAAPARDRGVRFAVMVINAYVGMPFSQLERAFAGLMLRDDTSGQHFDPRTVQLKFALDGENGVFMPLVLDIRQNVIHWLDVHAKGQFEFNNVETSRGAITKICPELMTYFESGARMSLFDLALLHAAARCERVYLRGSTLLEFNRLPDEDRATFHARLKQRQTETSVAGLPNVHGPPMLAMLYRGDLELPEKTLAYALFREQVTPNLSAGDLIG